MDDWPLETDYQSHSIKSPYHSKNEDRCILLGHKNDRVKKLNRGEIFAVFDGMGSAPRGAEAAQHMCDKLTRLFLQSTEPTLEDVKKILFKANMTLSKWEQTNPNADEGACAGTVVWIKGLSMTVFHAGDTMGVMLPFDAERDSAFNLFTPVQASGHILTNYFGMGSNLEIHISTQRLDDGDVIILFSDGIIEGINLATVATRTHSWLQRNVGHAVTSLCELAKQQGSRDDITAVMIELV